MRKKVGVVPSDASCPQVGAFLAALGQELTSSDVDTHLSGCIGCGNCGNSCNWFLTTGNQRLHPKNRADLVRQVFGRYFTFAGRLGRFLGLTPETTIEDLEVIRDVVFASCTECGRCALACNQGVSNRRLVQLARHALVAAGITPPVITKILSDARTKQHSFGLTFEESLGRVVALGEAEGVDVPVDRLGADLLLGCSAILNSSADGPKVIREGIQLLQRAGISFTLSSRVIDTGTEAYTTAGDLDLGRQFMVRTAEEAVRLGAWGIMVGECGCDMRSHFVEAGHIFNSRGLRTVYIDALLLEAHKRGRLPLVQLPLSVT
jgi:Fe-S oxidoreductase